MKIKIKPATLNNSGKQRDPRDSETLNKILDPNAAIPEPPKRQPRLESGVPERVLNQLERYKIILQERPLLSEQEWNHLSAKIAEFVHRYGLKRSHRNHPVVVHARKYSLSAGQMAASSAAAGGGVIPSKAIKMFILIISLILLLLLALLLNGLFNYSTPEKVVASGFSRGLKDITEKVKIKPSLVIPDLHRIPKSLAKPRPAGFVKVKYAFFCNNGVAYKIKLPGWARDDFAGARFKKCAGTQNGLIKAFFISKKGEKLTVFTNHAGVTAAIYCKNKSPGLH